MIDIIEKDRTVIIVLEEPTYEERLLLEQLKTLKFREDQAAQQQQMMSAQNGMGNNQNGMPPMYVRVRAWAYNQLILDIESLDRDYVYRLADIYYNDGFEVDVRENNVPTKRDGDFQLDRQMFYSTPPQNNMPNQQNNMSGNMPNQNTPNQNSQPVQPQQVPQQQPVEQPKAEPKKEEETKIKDIADYGDIYSADNPYFGDDVLSDDGVPF